jgi:hypothetical protein
MAHVEPAMNTLGGLDSLERTKRQECALELLPFDRVPYLVGPAVLILKVRTLLVPMNIKVNKCPRCLQPNETQEHILKCPHSGAH